jgi:hypothetical protein
MKVMAIVGFLDILGYKQLVTRMIDEDGFIKYFDDSMYEITINLLTILQSSSLPDNLVDEAYFKNIVQTIKVRCIYDNVIFLLPLSDVTSSSREFDKNTTIKHHIEAFFYVLAMFSTIFMSKISHFLRGGISIGSHYESERDNYLFIFSEAHNQAVYLERDKDKYPRILLDDRLRKDLIKMSFPYMDKFFYKDEYGLDCFDIYSIFGVFDKRKIIQTLTEIRESLIYHMEKNFTDKDILSKLIYFAKYHNRKVSSDGLNFPDLAINVNEFEKIIDR